MTNVTMKGKEARGKKELKSHLNGKKLSTKQAILGKCYDCMAGYVDGKVDCEMPDCSLYGYMPFGKAWKGRAKKPVSDAFRAASKKRFSALAHNKSIGFTKKQAEKVSEQG